MKTDVTRPNWHERLMARLKGIPGPFIQFDQAGLMLTVCHADGSESKTELSWSEVNGIVAYKRDCFAVDLICMGITTPDGAIEVNEEMDGWEALTDAIPTLLPGMTGKKEWWDKVAQPPFAANPTTLFSR